MVVGRHGCETGRNLVLGGDKLQQVCTVSHLGLTLASMLKWSDHVSGILKRAAPTAAALKKLGYCAHVSVDTMSLLYKTNYTTSMPGICKHSLGITVLPQTAAGSSDSNCPLPGQ